MEFKFRAVDDRPPPAEDSSQPQPSSSGVGFVPRQSWQGYPNMDPRQNPEMLMGDELLYREIEKARIREEIIAAEIARRRSLEAEVRRELMMEAEIAMRRGGCLTFEQRLAMQRLDPTLFSHCNNPRPEEHLAFPSPGVSPPMPCPPQPSEDNKQKLVMLVSLICSFTS